MPTVGQHTGRTCRPSRSHREDEIFVEVLHACKAAVNCLDIQTGGAETSEVYVGIPFSHLTWPADGEKTKSAVTVMSEIIIFQCSSERGRKCLYVDNLTQRIFMQAWMLMVYSRWTFMQWPTVDGHSIYSWAELITFLWRVSSWSGPRRSENASLVWQRFCVTKVRLFIWYILKYSFS